MPATSYDAVVIGAGLAGLVAARELARGGHSVAILEARPVVGGLACPLTPEGRALHLGGDWLAADHTQVRALTHQLGLHTVRPEAAGDDVYVDHTGHPVRFTGDLFPVDPSTEAQLLTLIARLDALLGTATPGTATPGSITPGTATPGTIEQGTITLGAWLETESDDAAARRALTLLIAGPRAGGSGARLPLAQALRLGAGAGSFSNVLDRSYRAQRRIQGGVPALVRALLAELAALGTMIITDHEVTGIQDHNNGVVVRAGDLVMHARAAVLATPGAARAALLGQPRGVGQGKEPALAIRASYPTAFWRQEGLSGQGMSPDQALAEVQDVSFTEPGGRGALVGFASGDAARRLLDAPAAQRRGAALASLASYVGSRAAEPLGYLEAVWSAGYGGVDVLAPSHFPLAGADLAGPGHGHLEGAVRSGSRAAHQVSALLRGEQFLAQQFLANKPSSTADSRVLLGATDGRES